MKKKKRRGGTGSKSAGLPNLPERIIENTFFSRSSQGAPCGAGCRVLGLERGYPPLKPYQGEIPHGIERESQVETAIYVYIYMNLPKDHREDVLLTVFSGRTLLTAHARNAYLSKQVYCTA
jgi:hypothetical protein